MKTIPRVRKASDYESCPKDLAPSLERYIEEGLHPGTFLEKVLSNDLFGAFSHADEINRYRLFDIVRWIYNKAPITSHGSKELFNNYLINRKKEIEEWKASNRS